MDAGAIKHVNIITMLGVVDININIRGKRIMPSMLPTSDLLHRHNTTLHPPPPPDLTSSSSPSSSTPASKQGCILIIQVPR
jgi:hypothetical protein